MRGCKGLGLGVWGFRHSRSGGLGKEVRHGHEESTIMFMDYG